MHGFTRHTNAHERPALRSAERKQTRDERSTPEIGNVEMSYETLERKEEASLSSPLRFCVSVRTSCNSRKKVFYLKEQRACLRPFIDPNVHTKYVYKYTHITCFNVCSIVVGKIGSAVGGRSSRRRRIGGYVLCFCLSARAKKKRPRFFRAKRLQRGVVLQASK